MINWASSCRYVDHEIIAGTSHRAVCKGKMRARVQQKGKMDGLDVHYGMEWGTRMIF